VRQRFPRDYVLNLERILFFCEFRFGRDETPYSGRVRSEFVELPSMTEWVEVNLLPVSIYVHINTLRLPAPGQKKSLS